MQAFRFSLGASGDPTSVTFPALPGKKYRVIGSDAATLGGSGGAEVQITGIDGAAGIASAPQAFSADFAEGTRGNAFGVGLLSKENTDFVFTITALASSIPRLNVWCSIENA